MLEKKVTLILALLACCSATYAAEVYYKWQDERGRIHYSAILPLQGEYMRFTKHGTAIEKLRTEKEVAQELPQDTPSVQLEASSQQEKALSETAATAKEQKGLQQNCAQAKTNWALLQSGQDVIRVDAESKKTVLGKQEREEALRQTRKDLEYFCEP